jgi:hypothetical protein
MKDKFKHFRDFIYVHKRFAQTRLRKGFTMIYGVSSSGQNILFGLALTDQKNDIPGNEWIFEQFNKYMDPYKPKAIIIE